MEETQVVFLLLEEVMTAWKVGGNYPSPSAESQNRRHPRPTGYFPVKLASSDEAAKEKVAASWSDLE